MQSTGQHLPSELACLPVDGIIESSWDIGDLVFCKRLMLQSFSVSAPDKRLPQDCTHNVLRAARQPWPGRNDGRRPVPRGEAAPPPV